MGHVYLAQDKRLNRLVAVKLLSFYDVAKEERIRRFRQEAFAASALNHPNILTIYEIGETEEHNFIVTEFVDGKTLLALIDSETVSVKKALDITIQIASALSAAHAAGIIHRDIKPANIMIRADGLLKVLDFGIAKYSQQDGERQRQESLVETPGTVIGTAAYMSPEQARGNPIDPRTDIWSLGVILYQLLTGRRPFAGETAMDVMSAVIELEPLPFSAHGLVVPESCERILFKALQKDTEARYQTADELLWDLKELSKKLEFAADNERNSAESNPGAKTDRLDTQPQQGETRQNNSKAIRYLLGVGALVLLVVVGALIPRPYFARHPQIESIAVMPFANESGNPDIEYLSDGMTESLINSLSQLPHLSVKSRSSVFRYKGKEAEPQRIASELSVQAILNGRIVQRGEELTLYLALVDAHNGNQIWGEQYKRKLSDLVVLQQVIARDVAQKLRARLSGAEEQKLAKNYTENPEAYQLYLRGLYHLNKLSPPEIRKSLEFFQQAVDVDPTYALAHADIGRAHFSLALIADRPSQEVFPKAREAAVKALKIDDTLAQAHTTVGWVRFWFDWDWSSAEVEFQRALSLNSNLADTHIAYANLLTFTGRHEEALSQAHLARELEPVNLRINALEGQTLFYAGKYDDAIVRLQKTIELEPTFFLTHLVLARVYVEKKMYSEAIAQAIKARDISGGHSESVAHLVYALAKSGRRKEAHAALDELKKRAAEQRYVPPYNLALAYYGLGEADKAIAWLEKGLQQRDVRMTFLKVDPKWKSLRTDPHFTDIMRRMGFQQ